MQEVKLKFISDFKVEKERILDMYVKFYGPQKGHQRFCERIPWYNSLHDFIMVVAEVDGNYVGQACAYGVKAIISNDVLKIHWGVDTFVLSEARGLGIGKQLQKKLHEDCCNFTSAWYSPVNGIIKKKCGGVRLFDVSFCYYPTSKLFGVYVDRVIRKFFKIDCHFQFPLKHFYTKINTFRRKFQFQFHEINFSQNVIDKMCLLLKDNNFDFYVERGSDFIDWKYLNNPNLKYHLFEISFNNLVYGYASFTEPFKTTFNDGNVLGVKVLDFIVKPDSSISINDIVYFIDTFYQLKNIIIDGVFSLQKSNYTFMRSKTLPVLSTCSKKIINPYLGYIDQDMEQMI